MGSKKIVRPDGFTRRSFVRIASVGAASIALFTLPTSAFADTISNQRQFVDSLGRTVSLAGTIKNVTPVGVHAQTLMTTLCPEGLVSLATNIDADAADYNEAGIGALVELPETGGIVSPATEEIAAQEIEVLCPELILDVGLLKDGLAAQLDALQVETGIPVFFLDISFGNLPSAYRMLGELLGYQRRAEELASYIEGIYGRVQARAASATTTCNVFYAPRKNGLMVRSSIEVQINAISFVGATPITTPYDYENKTVDLGILNGERVDLVVFDDTSFLDSFLSCSGEAYEIWKEVTIVAQGRFVTSPALLHSWFGSAVLVQTIGILWLANMVWPADQLDGLSAEVQTFYSLFYGLEKYESELTGLVGVYEEG